MLYTCASAEPHQIHPATDHGAADSKERVLPDTVTILQPLCMLRQYCCVVACPVASSCQREDWSTVDQPRNSITTTMARYRFMTQTSNRYHPGLSDTWMSLASRAVGCSTDSRGRQDFHFSVIPCCIFLICVVRKWTRVSRNHPS